jgi:hypothetical protein
MTSVHKPANRFHVESSPMRSLRLRRSVGRNWTTDRVGYQARSCACVERGAMLNGVSVFRKGAIKRD